MALQMPTTQRDQGLAVGAFLGIAAIVVYYMYVWTPKAEVLTQKQARIDTLTAQNEIARREIAKGTATKLKEEAEQYGRMLTLMRTLVPVANDLPLMIDQVSTAARQTGLELGNITAPVIMIAEKAADLIRGRAILPPAAI